MRINKVCLLGGCGFVGSHLLYRLSIKGIFCRVLTRNSEKHRRLLVHQNIEILDADIFDSEQLEPTRLK